MARRARAASSGTIALELRRRRRGTPRSRRCPGSASSASRAPTRVRSGRPIRCRCRGCSPRRGTRRRRSRRSRSPRRVASQGMMPSTACGSVRQCDQPYGANVGSSWSIDVAATRRMASPAAARSGGRRRGDHVAGLPAGVDLVHGREDEVAAGQTEAWRARRARRRSRPRSRSPRARSSVRVIHSMRSSGSRATSRASGRSSPSAARLPRRGAGEMEEVDARVARGGQAVDGGSGEGHDVVGRSRAVRATTRRRRRRRGPCRVIASRSAGRGRRGRLESAPATRLDRLARAFVGRRDPEHPLPHARRVDRAAPCGAARAGRAARAARAG